MAFSDGHTGWGTREEALEQLKPEMVMLKGLSCWGTSGHPGAHRGTGAWLDVRCAGGGRAVQ